MPFGKERYMPAQGWSDVACPHPNYGEEGMQMFASASSMFWTLCAGELVGHANFTSLCIHATFQKLVPRHPHACSQNLVQAPCASLAQPPFINATLVREDARTLYAHA